MPLPILNGSDCSSSFSPSRWTLFGLNEWTKRSPPWLPWLIPDAMTGLATGISRVTKSLPLFIGIDVNNVTEVRDSGPSLGKGCRGVRVDLGEGDGSPSGTLKPKVQASDPGEEARVGRHIYSPSPSRDA